MANMESEFVAFKMDMSQIVQSLQDDLSALDSDTKNKFTQSENALKLRLKKAEEDNKELVARLKRWLINFAPFHNPLKTPRSS